LVQGGKLDALTATPEVALAHTIQSNECIWRFVPEPLDIRVGWGSGGQFALAAAYCKLSMSGSGPNRPHRWKAIADIAGASKIRGKRATNTALSDAQVPTVKDLKELTLVISQGQRVLAEHSKLEKTCQKTPSGGTSREAILSEPSAYQAAIKSCLKYSALTKQWQNPWHYPWFKEQDHQFAAASMLRLKSEFVASVVIRDDLVCREAGENTSSRQFDLAELESGLEACGSMVSVLKELDESAMSKVSELGHLEQAEWYGRVAKRIEKFRPDIEKAEAVRKKKAEAVRRFRAECDRIGKMRSYDLERNRITASQRNVCIQYWISK
jgi:hypothetical protein